MIILSLIIHQFVLLGRKVIDMAKIQEKVNTPAKVFLDNIIETLREKYIDVKESFLPELEVQYNITEGEKGIKNAPILTRKLRRKYILEHTYLHEGSLETLAYHRDWAITEKDREGTSVDYATNPSSKKEQQHKRVKVSVSNELHESVTKGRLEEKLKFTLFERGANAGVNYEVFREGDYLIGQAIPARLTMTPKY